MVLQMKQVVILQLMTINGSLSNNTQQLRIGQRIQDSPAANVHFNGTIDNIQIFNRSLSAEQIKELYNNRSFIIVQNETVSDEVWYACVTPNDGTSDGNKACSNNVTITANYDPVINSNVTSPTTPSKTKTLQIIAN